MRSIFRIVTSKSVSAADVAAAEVDAAITRIIRIVSEICVPGRENCVGATGGRKAAERRC